MGLPSFFLKSQIFFRNFIATEYLYVSISVRYRLEVHTYFSFCFRDSKIMISVVSVQIFFRNYCSYKFNFSDSE